MPDDLAERDQWVLWKHQGPDAKKVPYRTDGHPASSTRPQSWASFEEVTEAFERVPHQYAGIGFVFSPDDPFCGLDLDDCIDAQVELKPWAQKIVQCFADTYMEMSPSKQGLKIWARGSVPQGVQGRPAAGGQIEMYSQGRYFTVTGDLFRGAPLEVADHTGDIQRLYEHLTQRPEGREAWPTRPDPGGRIPIGGRHNTLISLIGTFRARRICEEAIEAALQVINQRQCEEPLLAEEVSRIIRSTRKWN